MNAANDNTSKLRAIALQCLERIAAEMQARGRKANCPGGTRMARADRQPAGCRRPLSPALIAAGHKALSSGERQSLDELLRLLNHVPGRYA